MDFDNLLTHLGGCGRYQKINYVIVAFLAIPASFLYLGIVILVAEPDHWCAIPDTDGLNLTQAELKDLFIPRAGDGGYSQCTMYNWNSTVMKAEYAQSLLAMNSVYNISRTSCQHGWVYDRSQFQATVVTKWDLVCDKAWLRSTAKAIHCGAYAAGAIAVGIVRDLKGRKTVLLMLLLGQFLINLARAFSPNYIFFVTMGFFCSFLSWFFSTALVMMVEMMVPSYRSLATLSMPYFWPSGFLLLIGLAYFVRDWFIFQLVTCAVIFIFCSYYFFVDESARWLYTTKRTKRANKIIHKIAKCNKVTVPSIVETFVYDDKGKQEKAYIWDLMKSPNIRKHTLIMSFEFFVTFTVYDALTIHIPDFMPGNIYLNLMISAMVEIPSIMIAHATASKLGRKWPLIVMLAAAGLCLLATAAIPPGYEKAIIAMAQLGKLCNGSALGIALFYITELMPTVLRSTSLNFCYCVAGLGQFLAPYITLANRVSRLIPPLTFGSLALIGSLVAIQLPESKDKDLPETVEDAEHYTTKVGRTEDNASEDHEMKRVLTIE